MREGYLQQKNIKVEKRLKTTILLVKWSFLFLILIIFLVNSSAIISNKSSVWLLLHKLLERNVCAPWWLLLCFSLLLGWSWIVLWEMLMWWSFVRVIKYNYCIYLFTFFIYLLRLLCYISLVISSYLHVICHTIHFTWRFRLNWKMLTFKKIWINI